jgi:hypothetical protein
MCERLQALLKNVFIVDGLRHTRVWESHYRVDVACLDRLVRSNCKRLHSASLCGKYEAD